jgi:hypothetical protein
MLSFLKIQNTLTAHVVAFNWTNYFPNLFSWIVVQIVVPSLKHKFISKMWGYCGGVWAVTPCSLLEIWRQFGGKQCLNVSKNKQHKEPGRNMKQDGQSNCEFLADYTASHLGRRSYSESLQWEYRSPCVWEQGAEGECLELRDSKWQEDGENSIKRSFTCRMPFLECGAV